MAYLVEGMESAIINLLWGSRVGHVVCHHINHQVLLTFAVRICHYTTELGNARRSGRVSVCWDQTYHSPSVQLIRKVLQVVYGSKIGIKLVNIIGPVSVVCGSVRSLIYDILDNGRYPDLFHNQFSS